MRGRVLGGFLLAVVLALAAAGCGNASGGTNSAEGTSGGGEVKAEGSLTKASYIKEGDVICANVPTRYQKKLRTLPKAQQKEVTKSIPKAAVPPLREAAEELRKLGAPEGDVQEAEEIIAALEKAADGLEAKPKSGFSGPQSSFVEFQKLTKQYGFKICSRL
jgi:hypothetical protein